MAKIRIINDIARSSAALETTLETTLTRLKVIISDLSRSEPAIWVDNELSGYKMKSPLSRKKSRRWSDKTSKQKPEKGNRRKILTKPKE